jgi:hypothetical protein
VIADAITFIGWVLAGLFFGLWQGERHRRQDAQNREVYGQPRARPARMIPQPPDVEERARTYGHNPDTIKKGKEQLRAMYEAEGRRVSDEDLEAQVLAMLHPDTMTEGQFPA